MNKFQETTNSINTVISEYERLMAEVRQSLQDKMKDIFKSFFESHPDVKTIHWTQYAPHFNDGAECVFSVNDTHFSKTDYKDLESSYGEDDDGFIATRVWDPELRRYVDLDLDPVLVEDMRSLSSILQSDVNEDVLRAMFGTSVWIKAHRDGFDVDEHDHY